ncbi:MAG TPA: substrate-binding domain-containing protein [Spirillospora sp.]|nr:substrate-binding domain-containing protein [Spirillospora sp.]
MSKHYHIVMPLLLILLLAATQVNAQTGRWDGADNQPVSPLACPGADDNGLDETEPPYNGGQPTNAPSLRGQPITVVNLRQPISASYDAAVAKGMSDAANELGNVELINGNLSVVSVSQQAALLDEYIFGEVSGILVAAVDAQQDVSPSLRAALDAGIHVISYETDAEVRAREWFVRPAEDNAIAKILIDSLAEQAGENAGFAILTSEYDSPAAARLIAEIWAYVQQCYPGMEWLETAETQSDPTLAYNQAAILSRDYGGDLNGLVSVSIAATANAANAVSQQGRCNSVAVVGLAAPGDVRPHINSGCMQSAVLWNPIDLGYAAVHVMRAVADGALQPGNTSVRAGRLGELPIVNGSEILLDEPLVIDARNVNDLDF